MAYSRINWENTPSTATPRNATNLNVMDEGIYNNDVSITYGWNSAGETWTYVSVDDPTGIIKVNADVTTKYSLGMRIKFTNDGNTIYGILTKIGTYGGDEAGYTYLTFLHEIDPTDSLALYLMANSAITLNYYSTMKAPYGFPTAQTKWTIKKTDGSARVQSTPSNDTWYNIGTTNCQLIIPIGQWNVSYTVRCDGGGTSTTLVFPKVTLSTTNNSETNSSMTSGSGVVFTSSGNPNYAFFAQRNDIITLTSKTTHYLLGKVYTGGTVSLQFSNDNVGMVIQAICTYL